MRFILLVQATPETEAGIPPTIETITALTRYNKQLADAGVLVSADGIHQSATGARVQFTPDGCSVSEGPFDGELVCGWWVLDVRSRDDAIDWARQAPFTTGQIEVRKIIEDDDYCGTLTPERAVLT